MFYVLLISGLNVAGAVYTVAGLNKLRPRLKNVKLATSATQQETLTTCFLCQVEAKYLSGSVVLRDVMLRDVLLRDVIMSGGRLTVAGTIFYFRIRIHFTWIRIQHYRLNTDPDQTKN
jgi:hypothetical protein